jgi:hypothetical protein
MYGGGVFFIALIYIAIRFAWILWTERDCDTPVKQPRWPTDEVEAYYLERQGFRKEDFQQLENLSEKEGHGGC